MGDLSTNFSKWEFECKCGCGYDDISMELILLLEEIRADVGGPIRINSGCRCSNHNAAIGGTKHSRHMTGEAADIQVEGGWHRYKVLCAAVHRGAEGIGIAKGFIHCDIHHGSPECPRPSAWSY